MKKIVLICLAATALLQTVSAQARHAYHDDVQTIRRYDMMYAPPANPILFIGSSSIRKWDDLERTFAQYVVMNRGIGGAVTNDITYYIDDIVLPYHPRQIVIYVGDNDLADSLTTADKLLQRTIVLLDSIRAKLPSVPVLYMSVKPSPSRDKFKAKIKEANELIREYVGKQTKMEFVDIFSPMLDEQGRSRPELFLGDMLHMNAKGYAIWREAVEPHLLKQ